MASSLPSLHNFIGTGHLAFWKGSACPVQLPNDGKLDWKQRAKKLYRDMLRDDVPDRTKLKEVYVDQLNTFEGTLRQMCAGKMSTEPIIEKWGQEISKIYNHYPEDPLGFWGVQWYLNVYILEFEYGMESTNDFGITNYNMSGGMGFEDFMSYFKNKPTQTPKKPKKVRPNEPCPCGNGKKYKKCCMKK